MMNLGLAVEDAAAGEAITAGALEELALEQGVDISHLYAAAATTTDVEFAREHEVAFVACGGNCQNWGALECIEHLVTLQQERRDAGKDTFDVLARSCLDRCEHAPVVILRTPHGDAVIPAADRTSLGAAVGQAFDQDP